GVKAAFMPLDGSDIMVIAIDLEEFVAMQRERGWPPRFAGVNDAHVRAELRAGKTVFISQNLAALQGLAIGDSIDLATPDGPHGARITATVEDYSWPAGSVFVDRSFYREAWHDRTVTYTDIRLQPDVSIASAKQEIAGALKNRYQLFAYDVDDLMRTGSDA